MYKTMGFLTKVLILLVFTLIHINEGGLPPPPPYPVPVPQASALTGNNGNINYPVGDGTGNAESVNASADTTQTENVEAANATVDTSQTENMEPANISGVTGQTESANETINTAVSGTQSITSNDSYVTDTSTQNDTTSNVVDHSVNGVGNISDTNDTSPTSVIDQSSSNVTAGNTMVSGDTNANLTDNATVIADQSYPSLTSDNGTASLTREAIASDAASNASLSDLDLAANMTGSSNETSSTVQGDSMNETAAMYTNETTLGNITAQDTAQENMTMTDSILPGYPTSENDTSMMDTTSFTNATMVSGSNESVPAYTGVDLPAPPPVDVPVTFTQDNDSTVIEITSQGLDSITNNQITNVSYDQQNMTGAETVPAKGSLAENATVYTMVTTEATVTGMNDTRPAVSEMVTQAPMTQITPQQITVYTTTKPTPIFDPLTLDHPPPIFMDGRRPPTYTADVAASIGGFEPRPRPVPRQKQTATTEAPPPPPIVVPVKRRPPKYRLPLTTTTSIPLWQSFRSVKTPPPEADPRYMTVAELAELARKNIARPKQKGFQVFFNTVKPLTPEPTTTPVPFFKRPDVVFNQKSKPQRQFPPEPKPIQEPPKQFFNAEYLLNNIVGMDKTASSPGKLRQNQQVQPQAPQQPQAKPRQDMQAPSNVQQPFLKQHQPQQQRQLIQPSQQPQSAQRQHPVQQQMPQQNQLEQQQQQQTLLQEQLRQLVQQQQQLQQLLQQQTRQPIRQQDQLEQLLQQQQRQLQQLLQQQQEPSIQQQQPTHQQQPTGTQQRPMNMRQDPRQSISQPEPKVGQPNIPREETNLLLKQQPTFRTQQQKPQFTNNQQQFQPNQGLFQQQPLQNKLQLPNQNQQTPLQEQQPFLQQIPQQPQQQFLKEQQIEPKVQEFVVHPQPAQQQQQQTLSQLQQIPSQQQQPLQQQQNSLPQQRQPNQLPFLQQQQIAQQPFHQNQSPLQQKQNVPQLKQIILPQQTQPLLQQQRQQINQQQVPVLQQIQVPQQQQQVFPQQQLQQVPQKQQQHQVPQQQHQILSQQQQIPQQQQQQVFPQQNQVSQQQQQQQLPQRHQVLQQQNQQQPPSLQQQVQQQQPFQQTPGSRQFPNQQQTLPQQQFQEIQQMKDPKHQQQLLPKFPHEQQQRTQTQATSPKKFFDSNFLLRQIGLQPNELTPEVPRNTPVPAQNILPTGDNVGVQTAPTQVDLMPGQMIHNQIQARPQQSFLTAASGTNRQPLQQGQGPHSTSDPVDNSFTPYVRTGDLFSSQALEAWIKSMAIKPGILQQAQNENQNRITNSLKLHIRPQSEMPQNRQNTNRQNQPEVISRPTNPTRPQQNILSQVPQNPNINSAPMTPINRHSQNLRRPSLSLTRPREHVYGNMNSNLAPQPGIANRTPRVIADQQNSNNFQNTPKSWNTNHSPKGITNTQGSNVFPNNLQSPPKQGNANNLLRGMPNTQSSFQNPPKPGNTIQSPRGIANTQNSNSLQKNFQNSQMLQTPRIFPSDKVNSLGNQPLQQTGNANTKTNNKPQQFPLAQRLGFEGVLSDLSSLTNLDLSQITNQLSFQPNIITDTGSRPDIIPARTIEQTESHWSSKAGNSIKLPVNHVPYFMKPNLADSTANQPTQDVVMTTPSPAMLPNAPAMTTMAHFARRIFYTTTTSIPTPPPTADPNPPPIFDTRVQMTFMPFPKPDDTTRPTVNKGTNSQSGVTGNHKDSTIQHFDDRCSNCTYINDRCLQPDPVHCNMYIECVRMGSIVRAFNRECALGSFFDRKSYLCVDPQNADCPQDRCREPGLKWYPIHGHCKHYWSCASREGGGIYAQSECCPDMGGFVQDVGCVENRNCTESCDSGIVTAAPTGCHLRKTASPTIYFDANANIERPCAPGTLFNEQKCTCEQDVAFESSETRPRASACVPMLDVTFDNNTVDDNSNNNQHIGIEGVSTTQTGEGIFNGAGRLILWRYANLMFPVVFAVRFRFLGTQNGPRYQTVISNCDPKSGREPTFDISLDTKFHEVIFRVDTLESPLKVFKQIYQQNKWTSVVLIYDGERIVGSVDSRARNIIAGGGIETRPTPISVGACGSQPGLKGLLEDLSIYEDCIPDDMYGIFMSVLE